MSLVIAVRSPVQQASSNAPAAMWPGWSDSQGYVFSWFPPSVQVNWTGDPNAPDYYRVYKDGTLINMAVGAAIWNGTTPLNPGVTADAVVSIAQGSGNCPVGWFADRGIAPGASHTYHVTAVKNGVESVPGPSLTMTALTLGSSASPTPVNNPDGWIQSFALPTGGTTWTVTQTALANFNSTGTGALGNVGCGFGFALANSNPNGGDIIVLTAGSTYQLPASGATIPAYTGTNGWTYIISSNDPVLNPSASPALPGYALDTTKISCLDVQMTAAPAAGATSCTLAASQAGLTDASGKWLKKTGWYYVLFDGGPGNRPDERQALFTNGSATVDWSALNTLYPSAGLTFASASTALRTFYTPSVTPYDIAAMPTLAWGSTANSSCLSMNNTTSGAPTKVRIVGINMAPTPGVTHSLLIGVNWNNVTAASVSNPPLPTESVYFDRCIIGNDTNNPSWTAFGACFNGGNMNHTLVHGCYFWGICRDFAVSGGGESHHIILDGGNHCWQNNYFQCASQSIIYGAAFSPQPPNFPHDITYRYNMSHRPRSWQIGYNSSTFTGALSAGTLTVSNFTPTGWNGQQDYGPLQVGTIVQGGGLPNMTITALGTGTGGNGTYTVSNTTASSTGANLTGHINTSGTPWALFGQGTKNHFEFKAGTIIEAYGNCILNNWMGTIQSYHSAAFVFTPRSNMGVGTQSFPGFPNSYVAWVNDTDAYIHDNTFYYVGSIYYGFSNDPGPSAYAARIKTTNNIALIGSLNNHGFYGERIRIFNLQGPMSDLIFDHNTFLVNTGDSQGNSGTQLGLAWTDSGTVAGGYINGAPYTPNGFSRYQDRMTFTNNIMDCGQPSGAVTTNIAFSWALATSLPAAGFALGGYPNLAMGSNITINDPTIYQGTNKALQTYAPGTFSAVSYPNIGMANFQGGGGSLGPYLPPLHPSDWNVIAPSTYAMAGTGGTAIGATF